MNITCYIFTHTPEAPLLAPCIATARAGVGDHDAHFIVVEDGNSPLPQPAVADLVADGVSVVRSVSPRRGNLRGVRWFAEQMEIMSDHAGAADLVVKIDPDTLVLSLSNAVRPLAESPPLAGAGFGGGDQYIYGPCYAFRRWIVDYLAAKYAVLAGVEQEELRVATAITNGGTLARPVHEDVLLSREALAFGELDFGQKRARWRHQNDPRDLAAAKIGADVVLFGNPKPVSHYGADTNVIIARTMEAFLAADTVATPLGEGEKPVVVLGLGPGRSGTAFMATVLNMQPGCHITHESYSPLVLDGVPTEAFAEKLATRSKDHRFIGDVSLINTWMAERMTHWLVDAGYQVRLVATRRDTGGLVTSYRTAMERDKHDPMLSIPPEGWRHTPWSKAYPKFDDIPDRDERILAYIEWCAAKVAVLQDEFPGMVRMIDTADMNDPGKIGELFDWIGIPAAGRRLELLGTPINANPNSTS